MNSKYSVFVNCPLDDQYQPLLHAIVFAIMDCGYVPRCALEIVDSGQVRIAKILRMIAESSYGIHDISRTGLYGSRRLPRFNMPFELGLFLGAQHFGGRGHRMKACLVLDVERYRYQAFLSDISGQDIRAHDDDPLVAISVVRDWLRNQSGDHSIPGGSEICKRYRLFSLQLPRILRKLRIRQADMTYTDFHDIAADWLLRIG